MSREQVGFGDFIVMRFASDPAFSLIVSLSVVHPKEKAEPPQLRDLRECRGTSLGSYHHSTGAHGFGVHIHGLCH